MNVGWREQVAEVLVHCTGVQEKETGKEVGMKREGSLRMQSQERDWHWEPVVVGSAGKWME